LHSPSTTRRGTGHAMPDRLMMHCDIAIALF
jgi:hypothetical protein